MAACLESASFAALFAHAARRRPSRPQRDRGSGETRAHCIVEPIHSRLCDAQDHELDDGCELRLILADDASASASVAAGSAAGSTRVEPIHIPDTASLDDDASVTLFSLASSSSTARNSNNATNATAAAAGSAGRRELPPIPLHLATSVAARAEAPLARSSAAATDSPGSAAAGAVSAQAQSDTAPNGPPTAAAATAAANGGDATDATQAERSGR